MKRITATLLLISSLFIVTVFGQEKGSKKVFIIGEIVFPGMQAVTFLNSLKKVVMSCH